MTVTRTRMALAVVAAALAVFGVVGVLVTSTGRTVDGKVTIYGTSCPPSGGYSDLRAGAPVKITDDSGDLIALGRTDSNTITAHGSCVQWFTVDDVPAGRDFYGVEIANRGAVMFAGDTVFDPGEVDLSIGDPADTYSSWYGGY